MKKKQPLILIVDDDPTLRDTIALWLSGAGYRTAQADDGRQALAAVDREHPALILLDLRMPVLDGFGFLSEIEELPERPPVIVISGRGEVRDVVESFKRGVTDYIQKPIESYELLEHAVAAAIEAAGIRRRMLSAEARYFNLVQNLPLLVFALRPDFSLEFVNKACRTMLGFSRTKALTRPGWLLERVHPDDRDRIRDALGRAFSGHSQVLEDCRLIRGDATTLYAILKAMPAAPDPEGAGPLVEGMIFDITDRVELEKLSVQEEKLKTLGAVAAEVAHEIRNPLFAIAGFAKRLRDRHPEAREPQIILAEAARLEALVDRVRDYLHPVAPKPSRCPLEDVIRQVLKALEAELTARDITCRTSIRPGTADVEEDPEMLRQAVTNLVRHAAAGLPVGGAMELAAWSEAGFSRLAVSFPEKTPEKEPERLFLPFEESGKNAGLALARRLVKNMGGFLTYAHDAGRAVFTVALPLFPHAHESDVPPDAPLDAPADGPGDAGPETPSPAPKKDGGPTA